eukprot:10484701-Ditylum_brightwellii.AAC.1
MLGSGMWTPRDPFKKQQDEPDLSTAEANRTGPRIRVMRLFPILSAASTVMRMVITWMIDPTGAVAHQVRRDKSSPHVGRDFSSTSMNDLVTSEVEPQIPSNTLGVEAPSDSQETSEGLESPEALISEGEAILEFEPRKTGQVRQSLTWYTSGFEPASKWVANHARALFSVIEDSDL